MPLSLTFQQVSGMFVSFSMCTTQSALWGWLGNHFKALVGADIYRLVQLPGILSTEKCSPCSRSGGGGGVWGPVSRALSLACAAALNARSAHSPQPSSLFPSTLRQSCSAKRILVTFSGEGSQFLSFPLNPHDPRLLCSVPSEECMINTWFSQVASCLLFAQFGVKQSLNKRAGGFGLWAKPCCCLSL